MLDNWKRQKDRRGEYSFRAHFKRLVETKGFSRLALSLGATAVIAGTAFANCSSSDITGPSSDPPPAASAPGPQAATETAKEGPIKLPFPALPAASPCTGDVIAWDHGMTMMQGTTQITADPLGGRIHIQFHLNASGQGTSATRRYSGSQEYNSQLFTLSPSNKDPFRFVWNVKMIAKGEDGRLMPEDDFFLHVIQTFGPQPDFIPGVPEALALPGECK